jgi:hypothetical protein
MVLSQTADQQYKRPGCLIECKLVKSIRQQQHAIASFREVSVTKKNNCKRKSLKETRGIVKINATERSSQPTLRCRSHQQECPASSPDLPFDSSSPTARQPAIRNNYSKGNRCNQIATLTRGKRRSSHIASNYILAHLNRLAVRILHCCQSQLRKLLQN